MNRSIIFVDDEDRIVICQMLDDIVADNVAQGIGIPIPATKDRLLPPWDVSQDVFEAYIADEGEEWEK